jgi:excisionase family DNA binding protein
MTNHADEAEALLTPAEVAALFRVDPKTVTRWARAGKLNSLRTLGGHRRYRETEVRGLLGGVNLVDELKIVNTVEIVDGVDIAEEVEIAS